MARPLILALALVLAVFLGATDVHGHHTGVRCGSASGAATGRAVCLPMMDRSAAVQTLRAEGVLTWCTDFRATNYPSFLTQMNQILADHEAKIGIRWQRIPGSYASATAARNAGCQVWHAMPDVFECGNAAACIHYLNWPVQVLYNYRLGYVDWRTAQAHETVHLYGLHEHYDDARFVSHRQTYGFWAHGMHRTPGTSSDSPTVMDFGTNVYLLSEYDLVHICQSIDRQGAIFTGCGAQQEPEPEPEPEPGPITVDWGGGVTATWHPDLGQGGVWVATNGYGYEPSTEIWWLRGEREWTACNPDGLRWNIYLNVWMGGQSAFYSPARGYWSLAPGC